jgi:hypothetical protein
MKINLKSPGFLIALFIVLIGAFSIALLFYEPPTQRPDVTIDHHYIDTLDHKILNESLALGRQFLLNNQKPEGNFNYEYDFVDRTFTEGDNQVRQAGALWGISLIHKDNPSNETLTAALKALDFFDNISAETTSGGKYIIYPDDRQGSTGTVSLISLTLIELLQAKPDLPNYEKYEADLNKYLDFLISLRLENGQIASKYSHETGEATAGPSPYFDGETLLAFTKAANYMNRQDLKEMILESAESMYEENIKKALKEDPDSNTTKGFYQWSSMSFYEIYTSGWDDVDKYADYTIDLAYWMIDAHETLTRTRNTAYAYEGLISAWELARLTSEEDAMIKIGNVIDEGLFKLTSWQVGGPNQNSYLLSHPTEDKFAVGGIMNHRQEPPLRIDVTQHQMHAVILALKFIYNE